jgi:hypothetical protein
MDWNVEWLERERQEATWLNTAVGALLGLSVFIGATMVWLFWLA